MTDTPSPRWRLRSPDLLRTLMQHTGDGSRVSIRELAEHVGCAPSHIHKLLMEKQETVSYEHVASMCERLGVVLLVLAAPETRADRARALLQKVAG